MVSLYVNTVCTLFADWIEGLELHKTYTVYTVMASFSYIDTYTRDMSMFFLLQHSLFMKQCLLSKVLLNTRCQIL